MSKTENSSKLIAECAFNLFRKQGFTATTVADICNAAGITKTTFYYHYKSKQELLQTGLLRPVLADSITLQHIFAAESCWKQLWLLTDNAIKNYLSVGPEIVREILQMNLIKNIGTFDIPGEEFFQITEPLVLRAQASGEIRNHSKPASLIFQCWKIQTGCILLWCIKGSDFDLRREFLRALEVAYDVSPEYRFELED